VLQSLSEKLGYLASSIFHMTSVTEMAEMLNKKKEITKVNFYKISVSFVLHYIRNETRLQFFYNSSDIASLLMEAQHLMVFTLEGNENNVYSYSGLIMGGHKI
jgi:hypothetical protein